MLYASRKEGMFWSGPGRFEPRGAHEPVAGGVDELPAVDPGRDDALVHVAVALPLEEGHRRDEASEGLALQGVEAVEEPGVGRVVGQGLPGDLDQLAGGIGLGAETAPAAAGDVAVHGRPVVGQLG